MNIAVPVLSLITVFFLFKFKPGSVKYVIYLFLACFAVFLFRYLLFHHTHSADMPAHLTRTAVLAEYLKKGILFPVMQRDIFTGMNLYFFSQPIFLFYPGSFYLVPAALNLAGLPDHTSIRICALFIFLAGSFFTYKVFKKKTGTFTALCIAVLYTFIPLRTNQIFLRAAVPEALSFLFFPLILHFLERKISAALLLYFISIVLYPLNAVILLLPLAIHSVIIRNPRFAVYAALSTAFYILPVYIMAGYLSAAGGGFDLSREVWGIKDIIIPRFSAGLVESGKAVPGAFALGPLFILFAAVVFIKRKKRGILFAAFFLVFILMSFWARFLPILAPIQIPGRFMIPAVFIVFSLLYLFGIPENTVRIFAAASICAVIYPLLWNQKGFLEGTRFQKTHFIIEYGDRKIQVDPQKNGYTKSIPLEGFRGGKLIIEKRKYPVLINALILKRDKANARAISLGDHIVKNKNFSIAKTYHPMYYPVTSVFSQNRSDGYLECDIPPFEGDAYLLCWNRNDLKRPEKGYLPSYTRPAAAKELKDYFMFMEGPCAVTDDLPEDAVPLGEKIERKGEYKLCVLAAGLGSGRKKARVFVKGIPCDIETGLGRPGAGFVIYPDTFYMEEGETFSALFEEYGINEFPDYVQRGIRTEPEKNNEIKGLYMVPFDFSFTRVLTASGERVEFAVPVPVRVFFDSWNFRFYELELDGKTLENNGDFLLNIYADKGKHVLKIAVKPPLYALIFRVLSILLLIGVFLYENKRDRSDASVAERTR